MIVKVADFRNNMAYYLEHLGEDIFLTRHGKVVGVVSAPQGGGSKVAPDELTVCLHELKAQMRHLDDLLQAEKRQ